MLKYIFNCIDSAIHELKISRDVINLCLRDSRTPKRGMGIGYTFKLVKEYNELDWNQIKDNYELDN